MRAKVEFYQAKEGETTIPLVMLNKREKESKLAIDRMVEYGVEKVVVNYVNLGLKSWSNIGFTAMSIVPPEPVLRARNFLLRHLADWIVQFGILEITLYPTITDLQAIRASWAALEGKKLEDQGLPLNIETDPVGPDTLDSTIGQIRSEEPAAPVLAVLEGGPSNDEPRT